MFQYAATSFMINNFCRATYVDGRASKSLFSETKIVSHTIKNSYCISTTKYRLCEILKVLEYCRQPIFCGIVWEFTFCAKCSTCLILCLYIMSPNYSLNDCCLARYIKEESAIISVCREDLHQYRLLPSSM